MKERPIIFNSEMIRAILEDRKTQTRRPIKGNPINVVQFIGRDNKPTDDYGFCQNYKRVINKHIKCPFGQVGDRLWVRESIYNEDGSDWIYFDCCYVIGKNPPEWIDKNAHKSCIPSIHMPRWASRITLEITNIRVEQLQNISEDDAHAEGLNHSVWAEDEMSVPEYTTAKEKFKILWESIYGNKSWNLNPYVWVIEFKKIK